MNVCTIKKQYFKCNKKTYKHHSHQEKGRANQTSMHCAVINSNEPVVFRRHIIIIIVVVIYHRAHGDLG